MSIEEVRWQWWRLGLRIAVVLVFCLHVYTLLSQLMERPTASSFTLIDDVPPRMPAVTVCPPLPFPIDTLIDFGIDTSCDTYEDCYSVLIEDLQGISHNVSVQELWDASLLPLSTYVHSTSIHGIKTTYHPESTSWPHWKPTMTSLGPCWTLTPPIQEEGDAIEPLTISIKTQIPCSIIQAGIFYLIDPWGSFPFCEDTVFGCKYSCSKEKLGYSLFENYNKIVAILHDPKELPFSVDATNTITIYDNVGKETSVNTWVSLREISLLESDECVSDPTYSFTRCMSLCQDEYERKEFECLSSSNFANIRNKTCILEYFKLRPVFLTNLQKLEEDEETTKCKKSCKTPCKNTLYTFTNNYVDNNFNDQEQGEETKVYTLTLQMSAPYTETIVEEVIYTTSKFLADLGGSLGLCFGFGLLTLHEFLYSALIKLVTWVKKVIYHDKKLNGQMSQSIYLNHTETPFQNMWTICVIILCVIAYLTHSLQLTVNFWEYNKVSVPKLGFTLPPFPEVTLCPDVPFDILALSEHGLAFQNETELEQCYEGGQCTRDEAISYLFNALPGIWESKLTLESIWNLSRPIDTVIQDYKYDHVQYTGNTKEILTTMGRCFILSPDEYAEDTILLEINLAQSKYYTAQEFPLMNGLYDREQAYSVILMLNPLHITPVSLSRSAITHEKNEIRILSLEIGIITVKRISTPREQCQEAPFSRKQCIDLCILKEGAKKVGCRLPYLQEYDLPLCNSSNQYRESYKGNGESPGDKRKHCEQTCGIECETVYYKIEPEMFDTGNGVSDKSDINIKKPVFSTLEITEELKTSLLSYLSEMGGIMGLYLGMSLLDLITLILWPAMYLLKRMGLFKFIVSSHMFKLLKIVWLLMMSFLLMNFSLARFQDFVINPKYYTKYSDQINKWKDFPGVSICRWPPFNLTNLASLGLSFDIGDYCQLDYTDSKYYCSGLIEDFMNNLPGLEKKSVHMIWEQAALDLSDMLNGYTFNGDHYVVGSPNASHWKPTITSLNQCFSFIPPDAEEEASDLDLYLSNAGLKFFEPFDNQPTEEQVLQDSMKTRMGTYRAQNIVRIHSPNDDPKTGDVPFSYPLYLTIQAHHLLLTTTLTEFSSFSGTNQQCREEDTYSPFNCVQECLLREIVKQEKCKLPFSGSFPIPDCNVTSYKNSLKYISKIASKLSHYKSKKQACSAACLPSCKTLSYDVSKEIKRYSDPYHYDNGYVKVTVRMGKRSHDVYEEVPALSWASFVAEVGGVAGILTGVSLMMLTQFLLNGIIHLYASMKDRLVRDGYFIKVGPKKDNDNQSAFKIDVN